MTDKKYIVALDQGTTSSRAVVMDHDANIVSVSQREFEQIYPKPGWVEHDPMEIWASQSSTLVEALAKADINSDQIAAIGITNQRETVVVWERETGKPIYNAIVWQCRRTAEICEQLKRDGMEEYIRKATGLVVDPYFSGTKVKWILDHVEGSRERAKRGELLFGTVDTWLIWKMTQGRVHVTDYTNASRTMLFNIHDLDWDDKMLDALDIPRAMLPEVRKSSEVYGQTNIGGKGGTRIPIAGIAGDDFVSSSVKSIESSTRRVLMLPAGKSGPERIRKCAGIVVCTPSILNSVSARIDLRMASSRSRPRTMSLAMRLS